MKAWQQSELLIDFEQRLIDFEQSLQENDSNGTCLLMMRDSSFLQMKQTTFIWMLESD